MGTTREEAIAFFKDMNECTYGNLEAVEMAISALSTEGEYIKKADILNEMGDTNMDILTDEVKEIVNGLPSYSIPDSKSVINKVLEVIKSQRFKVYDWYASLAPTVGDSWREEYEADMEIYDGVIEAVELYRDSVSDNSDSADDNTMEWIHKPHIYGVTYCSKCDYENKVDDTRFCPNCGRKAVNK